MDEVSQQRFDEIVKLDPAALEAEQREFLNARKEYLTQDQRRIFADVLIKDKSRHEELQELSNKDLTEILEGREVGLPEKINKENLIKAVEDSEPKE